MFRKILGLFLFFLGLSIIVLVLLQSYNIFTGRVVVPEIFQSEEFIPTPAEKPVNAGTIEGSVRVIVQEEMRKVVSSFLPSTAIAKMMNLTSWSLFTGIGIFAGAKIAGLGIVLLSSSRKED